MYRWHSLFAAQCRRILERRDPLLAERLHRIAARYYQDTDVCECVTHALQGNAPRQAVASLGEHWLEFLLCNGAHALEQVCRDLPAPWNEDPEILMVSSVCRALDGDGAAASELTQRALARTSVLDDVRRRKFDQCRALFEPLPASGRPDVRTPAADGRSLPTVPWRFIPPPRSGLFLLAQAEFRMHRIGDQATVLLQSAEGAANQHLGGRKLCADAELALAFAVGGDLETADELGDAGVGAGGRVGPEFAGPDGGSLAGTRNRLLLEGRAEGCPGPPRKGPAPWRASYSPSARSASSTRSWLTAPPAIKPILPTPARRWSPSTTKGCMECRGRTFHTIARAKIAEANGDLDGALTMVAPLGAGGHAPLVDVLLAELLRRGGEAGAAELCAKALTDGTATVTSTPA